MKKGTCHIFAAGDFEGSFSKCENDLIIAADAGYKHLKKLDIVPDILLGDFDTIGELPKHENIITFPCEKDYTDTELSILEGIKQGYTDFIIYGATGGKRLEHTVANLSLAASYAEKGFDILLTDGSYNIKALHNGKYNFSSHLKGFISVFTISGRAEGVTEVGLKYPLDNATLDSTNPTLCVSNEFTGVPSSVSVKCGTVLIIWQNIKD